MKLEKCIGSEHAIVTMQTWELAYYSVQSDDAIVVYKAIKQSQTSAFVRQKTGQSLDDSNHKIS
jgi:hypothetical protein